MTDPITKRVTQILSESEHILVPLDELYDRLANEGLMVWMTPELLEQFLMSDDTFEIYEGLADSDLFNPMVQSELQTRGLLGGPLVMLQERATSGDEVLMDMLLHLQEMNTALETAWQLRPENNPDIEAELLNLLMMGDMLEREIKRALDTGSIVVELDPNHDKSDLGTG
ncbi:MAG: hypothetical protein MUF84_03800 [Anaerolineae bacterium]|jgi:hypothetical protein|nr:hypothetical protein [Anaerolineae bacterium]